MSWGPAFHPSRGGHVITCDPGTLATPAMPIHTRPRPRPSAPPPLSPGCKQAGPRCARQASRARAWLRPTGVEEGRGRRREEAAAPKARGSILLTNSPGNQAVPTFPSSRRAGGNSPLGSAPRHLLGSHAHSLLGLSVIPGLPLFQACMRSRGYLVEHLPCPRVDTPVQTDQEGPPPPPFLLPITSSQAV